MSKIPVPAIIAIVVIAIGLAIFSVVKTVSPHEYHPTEKPLVNEDTKWLRETAKRVSGDVTKLTPAERQRADKITRGYTTVALPLMAKETK